LPLVHFTFPLVHYAHKTNKTKQQNIEGDRVNIFSQGNIRKESERVSNFWPRREEEEERKTEREKGGSIFIQEGRREREKTKKEREKLGEEEERDCSPPFNHFQPFQQGKIVSLRIKIVLGLVGSNLE
jgi:hypothetical protein